MCEFCGCLGTAEDIEAHEKVYKYNPETKSCMTCKHCRDTSGCSQCSLDGVFWDGKNCSAYEFGKPIKVIAV